MELDLPICVACGVPDLRVPMACQNVALVDEVCWFFPDAILIGETDLPFRCRAGND